MVKGYRFITPSLLASTCFGTFWSILFNLLNFMFGSGSRMRVQYPKCAYGPYRSFNQIKNGRSLYLNSYTYIGPATTSFSDPTLTVFQNLALYRFNYGDFIGKLTKVQGLKSFHFFGNKNSKTPSTSTVWAMYHREDNMSCTCPPPPPPRPLTTMCRFFL